MVAAITICGLAFCIVTEWQIASASARMDASAVESSLLRRALRDESAGKRASGVERAIGKLNLNANATTRAALVIQTLEHASAYGVQVVSMQRREIVVGRKETPPDGLRADGYAVVLRGGYPQILRLVAAVTRVPFVTRIRSINFERVRIPTNPATDVQATIELAVFTIKKNDAGA